MVKLPPFGPVSSARGLDVEPVAVEGCTEHVTLTAWRLLWPPFPSTPSGLAAARRRADARRRTWSDARCTRPVRVAGLPSAATNASGAGGLLLEHGRDALAPQSEGEPARASHRALTKRRLKN